ncbi:acetyl-CoA synthase subunit gamma [bacterium]|nr:acetyl-CoA synthase subunit gamma [Candidatus Omnitrophota bacterium]MBU2527916.1 acetyl-CoA synthase subunit gamma [bacterium]MBU3929269.1 acetyl-CoA synthase subunit gamma [bacterium]MBU4122250.1 acetyl-CoA synthase subunit gamma [bacterium]
MKEHYFTGEIDTETGSIPVVATSLSFLDKLGDWKVRWTLGRGKYMVVPGIYATGSPAKDSPVMVSANYKLSFDMLRQALAGFDTWILVLDTKGVNVWCAAGKGTFGTAEIVRRIEETGLTKIVNHREIIVPQLGAPGVSAGEVKKRSGFSVKYGPVRAEDLSAFLGAGKKTTAEMRTVKFEMRDRLKLIPAEIMIYSKYLLLLSIIFFLSSGFGPDDYIFGRAINTGVYAVTALLAAFFSGTVINAILLPWLPGRSFSVKGFYAGLFTGCVLFLVGRNSVNNFELWAWLILVPAISSFLAMNFTGASTYTSLSGVKKEMKIAIPIQAAAILIGVVLWIIGRFVA